MAESSTADPAKVLEEAKLEPEEPTQPEEFAATGLDNALEMLSLVTAKSDKASVGREAAGIESHPEVCAFSSWF